MKLTEAEIEQHYENSRPVEDDGLYFQEPAQDEVIEKAYDPSRDDWLFDDYAYLLDYVELSVASRSKL